MASSAYRTAAATTMQTWPQVIARATTIYTLGFVWTWLFWFQPARTLPGVRGIVQTADNLFAQVPLTGDLGWAFRSYVCVLLPLLVIVCLVRRPTALGLGRAARYSWRILAMPFVVALPFLVWLGLRPGMHAYYRYLFESEGCKFLLANALVIVIEHAWFEGLILALALPGGGFGTAEDPPRTGFLSFLGFGFPVQVNSESDSNGRERSLCSWVGIPPKVLPCLVLQALAFGAVHMGKYWGEVVTAFPGGLGLGILTYRTRSFWPSAVLHIGTGSIVFLTILISR